MENVILLLQFMFFTGNKSPKTIFGTFICQFHISPALSEKNIPLHEALVAKKLL
jgi:hypothetical protein